MRRARSGTLGLGLILLLTSVPVAALASHAADSSPTPTMASPLRVRLETVTDIFEHPVLLVGAGDGSGDRYVVEQRGSIWRIDPDGSVADTPLLDISERVHYRHERGMLGLAFHPRFEENGRLFVTYTRRPDFATVLSEFTLPSRLEEGDDGSLTSIEKTERTLLVLAQPGTIHKGGMLEFDDAGMLLFSVGDGGAPGHVGLDTGSMLGKLLRLDVDSGWPYGLPPDNGFAALPGAHPEIHAIGLRNPWRFSIDRATGAVYIGDVGQSEWEEIDVLPAGSVETSFGWGDMEGNACVEEQACVPSDHRAPGLTYAHLDEYTGNCAVVGGYVYRGAAGSLPDGLYVFSDYCSGTIWGASAEELLAGTAEWMVIGQHDLEHGQILAFGQDDDGELYVMSHEGDILHIVSDPGDAPDASVGAGLFSGESP